MLETEAETHIHQETWGKKPPFAAGFLGSKLHLAMVAMLGLVAVTVALTLATASSLCLPNGIAAELRRNLSNEDESFPVGVLLGGWSSAYVTSAVLEILIAEVLGYNVYVDPTTPSSSLDAIYGILGCATWNDPTNRGCEDRKVRRHFMSESC